MTYERRDADRRQRGGSLRPLRLGLMLVAGLLGGGPGSSRRWKATRRSPRLAPCSPLCAVKRPGKTQL